MKQGEASRTPGMVGTSTVIAAAATAAVLGVSNSAGQLPIVGAALAGITVVGGFNPGPTNSESGAGGSGDGKTTGSNMPAYYENNADNGIFLPIGAWFGYPPEGPGGSPKLAPESPPPCGCTCLSTATKVGEAAP